MKPEGIEYLKKVQKLIERRPEQFNMGDWIVEGDYSYGTVDETRDIIKRNGNDPYKCDTVCCVAGWVALLAVADGKRQRKDEDGDSEHVEEFAMRVLGTKNDYLFYTFKWPDDLNDDYHNEVDEEGQARVTHKAIQRYIDTDGNW